MDIAIPTVPTGVVILVNLFAPYLVSLVTASFWPSSAKKWVSIGVSLVLAAIVLVLYYAITHEPLTLAQWPSLLLLGVVVTQFSYGVLVKDSADKVAKSTGVGASKTVVVDSKGVATK